MAASVTTFDALLKDLYSDQRVADLIAQACPTFGLMKKKTGFDGLGGRRLAIPVNYGANEGIGPTVANAITAQGNSKSADFLLTRKTLIGRILIDRELMEAAQGDRASFLDAMDHEVNVTERAFFARVGSQVFANGGGSVGRIASTSTVNTETITLSDPRDAVNFRPGMVFEADDTDGSGGGAVRAGTQTIKAVDYTNGTVTGTLHWDDVITNVAASDYLFPVGQFGLGAAGFAAWCPASAPTGGDSFYNVDRSVAVNELAGLRVTAGGGTMEDSLLAAAVEGARLGREFSHIVLNPYRVGILIRELGSKATYIQTDSNEKTIGTSVLAIHTPVNKGALKVVSDPYCQADTAWFINMADWAVVSTKSGVPHMQKDMDGRIVSQMGASTDTLEMRLAAYWNIACYNPGQILRCDF